MTGFIEVLLIPGGEISLANPGGHRSLWVSCGCCGQSYSYRPFQTPLQGSGQRPCPSAMSSSRATGPREQMAEDDICIWAQSISNARHWGSTASLLSQAWGGGCFCLHRLRSLLSHRLKGPKALFLLPGIKVSVITRPVPVHI